MTLPPEADPNAVAQAEADRRAMLAELGRILDDDTLTGLDRDDLEAARTVVRDAPAFCVHPDRLALYLGYLVMVGVIPEILSGVRYTRSDNSAARMYIANPKHGDRCVGTAVDRVTVYGPPVPLATMHTEDMSTGPSWTAGDDHDERIRMLAARWRVGNVGVGRIGLFLMLPTGPYRVDDEAADVAGSLADHLHPETSPDLGTVLASTGVGAHLDLDDTTVTAAAEPLLTAARDRIVAALPAGHPARPLLAGDVWTNDVGHVLRTLALDPPVFRAVAALDWAIGYAKGTPGRLSRVAGMTARIPDLLAQEPPAGTAADTTRLVWVWPFDDTIIVGTAQDLGAALATAGLTGEPMPERVYAAHGGDLVEVFPRIQAAACGSVEDGADYATYTMVIALPVGGVAHATWTVDGRV